MNWRDVQKQVVNLHSTTSLSIKIRLYGAETNLEALPMSKNFKKEMLQILVVLLCSITSCEDYAMILRIPQRDPTSNYADHQHCI